MADTTVSMAAATPTTVDRTDLLARLRVELHDEDSGNYRWTSATLQRHLERAVRELSQVWPRERLSVLSTTAGSRDIDVGALADLVRIEAVEWPADQFPPVYVQWSIYLTTMTLLTEAQPAAVEDVRVYWGSLHLVDDTQSTLPTVAEDAVITGAAGYAALEYASFSVNRANVAGTAAYEQARMYGELQLQLFQQLLGEFGKRSRVRVAGLFTPAGQGGRDVVRWEP